MEKELLLAGTTQICGETVDFKVWGETEEDSVTYEWDINPYLVDVSQMTPHRGGVNIAESLDHLFFRFNTYREEIKQVKDRVYNPNF